jgi:hypothetical protein
MGGKIVDNRGSSRYSPTAGGSAVYLGWWHDEEFRTAPAEIVNLSHGGALVRLASPPPDGPALWLCLARTPPGEWVEVSVVELARGPNRSHCVRLAFPEGCPYEMFQVAVLGQSGPV